MMLPVQIPLRCARDLRLNAARVRRLLLGIAFVALITIICVLFESDDGGRGDADDDGARLTGPWF